MMHSSPLWSEALPLIPPFAVCITDDQQLGIAAGQQEVVVAHNEIVAAVPDGF